MGRYSLVIVSAELRILGSSGDGEIFLSCSSVWPLDGRLIFSRTRMSFAHLFFIVVYQLFRALLLCALFDPLSK